MVLSLQLFSVRWPSKPIPKPAPAVRRPLSPFGENVYRQEAYFEQLEPGTQCKPKAVFSAELPVSHAMAGNKLASEAQRVAAEFEYSADDVNKGVQEFIAEMSEGLEKQGTFMSQIPTYVTNVPNGTEKVRTTNI